MPTTFLSKFIIWNAMLVWLGVFYYGPQWFPLSAPYELTPSFLDHAIPFFPTTAWIYQSLFFLLPLATFLQPDRETLARFTSGFCCLVLTFSIFFWLCPTDLQLSVALVHSSWAYDHLVAAVDGRRNAFPSLHAALTTYAGLSIIRLYRGLPLICASVTFWSLALLVSTLTTKQHIMVDVGAGVIAGLVAYALAFFKRITIRLRTA
jgi:hypothetical protein